MTQSQTSSCRALSGCLQVMDTLVQAFTFTAPQVSAARSPESRALPFVTRWTPPSDPAPGPRSLRFQRGVHRPPRAGRSNSTRYSPAPGRLGPVPTSPSRPKPRAAPCPDRIRYVSLCNRPGATPFPPPHLRQDKVKFKIETNYLASAAPGPLERDPRRRAHPRPARAPSRPQPGPPLPRPPQTPAPIPTSPFRVDPRPGPHCPVPRVHRPRSLLPRSPWTPARAPLAPVRTPLPDQALTPGPSPPQHLLPRAAPPPAPSPTRSGEPDPSPARPPPARTDPRLCYGANTAVRPGAKRRRGSNTEQMLRDQSARTLPHTTTTHNPRKVGAGLNRRKRGAARDAPRA
ncbi:unnamed protein product [Rangifer tarandus platyrhynchus]|uniref:Uncharacterized protein n=2 Tax=Rangifer tarandus platyrhynchus TaxID=3082113 RepID=A0ACB0ENR4_RANTA|nr:unnamed protein product [Rangifer tarandus platyrhynchus]CAI9702054.1 unnamed protein product [Rangifer tarandus platyrhynchus]